MLYWVLLTLQKAWLKLVKMKHLFCFERFLTFCSSVERDDHPNGVFGFFQPPIWQLLQEVLDPSCPSQICVWYNTSSLQQRVILLWNFKQSKNSLSGKLSNWASQRERNHGQVALDPIQSKPTLLSGQVEKLQFENIDEPGSVGLRSGYVEGNKMWSILTMCALLFCESSSCNFGLVISTEVGWRVHSATLMNCVVNQN